MCVSNTSVDGDSISLDGEEKVWAERGKVPPGHDNLRFLLDIDVEMASWQSLQCQAEDRAGNRLGNPWHRGLTAVGSGEVAQEKDVDTTGKETQDTLILDDEQKRRIQERR